MYMNENNKKEKQTGNGQKKHKKAIIDFWYLIAHQLVG